MNDTRLVEGLKEGSDEAVRELLDRFQGKIFNTVLRFVQSTTDTEDVVQEVFMKAMRSIDSFNFQASLYTWLYRIAVNAALDHRKRAQRHKAVSIHHVEDKTYEIPAENSDPTAPPEQKELAQRLRIALDELPEKYRTILVLREFDYLSYEEISKVLGCSKGTVESRLFRARERLRKKMEKYL